MSKLIEIGGMEWETNGLIGAAVASVRLSAVLSRGCNVVGFIFLRSDLVQNRR